MFCLLYGNHGIPISTGKPKVIQRAKERTGVRNLLSGIKYRKNYMLHLPAPFTSDPLQLPAPRSK
jgi:hypothetical protein